MTTGHTHSTHSTGSTPAAERPAHWAGIIAETYFPLQLEFRDPSKFNGRLSHWSLGNVALSRLTSDAVSYTRRDRHIRTSREEEYLVTIPRRSPVEFRQMGRDVKCDPGGFIIERGDEPYRFRYDRPNDLSVIKVSKAELSTRVTNPDRLCARVFDATRGSARLFASMAALAQDNGVDIGAEAQDALGRQLLVFLALALNDATPSDADAMTAVRAAHLTRIDRFIRDHIKNPDLSPEMIAAHCGISKRYLHDLYCTANKTVLQQVRDYRLAAVRDDLTSTRMESLSRLAYRYGFADQSQFSRLFKAKFGMTPSAYRRGAIE